MKNTAVASRYAKALLELAVELNKVDSVAGDMNYLLTVSEASYDFELLVLSPVIRTDKKIGIFEKIFEQFEDVSMSFVKLITKNRRESLLPAIAESFGRQVLEHKGIVPVTIKSAQKLDNQTLELILGKIDNSIQGTPQIEEIIDEELIGGFVVQMGDTRIDASVSSQFANLKQRLTK